MCLWDSSIRTHCPKISLLDLENIQFSFLTHLRTFRLEQWNCSRAAKWRPTSHSLKVSPNFTSEDWIYDAEVMWFEATRPIRSTSPKSLGVQNRDGCGCWHRGLLAQKCKRCEHPTWHDLSMSFIFFQVQTPNIFSRPFWNFEFSIFTIFQLKLVSSASGHTIRLDLAIRADAKAAAAPSQSIRPGSNSPCSVDSAFCVSVSGASGDVEAKSPKRHARCQLIQKDFGSEAKGSRNLHYEII